MMNQREVSKGSYRNSSAVLLALLAIGCSKPAGTSGGAVTMPPTSAPSSGAAAAASVTAAPGALAAPTATGSARELRICVDRMLPAEDRVAAHNRAVSERALNRGDGPASIGFPTLKKWQNGRTLH